MAVVRVEGVPSTLQTLLARPDALWRTLAALASLVATKGVIRVVIIESDRGQRDLTARGAHLRAVARWAGTASVSRWVIERDDSVLAADRHVLTIAKADPGVDTLEYVHVAAVQDPVLWAADLVAWSWARGGEFRNEIEPLVVARIRV